MLDGHSPHTTRSLTGSEGDSSPKYPLKLLELNIDKLSPEQVKHVSNSSPISPKTFTTTTQQTDILCLNNTSPIRIYRTPFTPLYSPPNRITKLAKLESNEVLPEIELMISKFFKEFVNTDVLPVLRGILTFKTFRYRTEAQNEMISPYIEKSVSIPLHYNNFEYTFKMIPLSKRVLSRGCSSNQAMMGRRAVGMTSSSNSFQNNSKLVSDTSFENCPIKLLETSQTKLDTDIPSKIYLANIPRNNLVKTPNIIRFNNSLETSNIFVPNNSYENCPIKLLETSQTKEDTSIRETPIQTQLTSNNIRLNKPLLNISYENCPIKLLETSQTKENTSNRETPAKTPQTSNNIRLNKPLVNTSYENCPIKLLETSQTKEDASNKETLAKSQLTSNSIHLNKPLPNTSYDTYPIKLLETSQMKEDTSITVTPTRIQLTNISQTGIVRTPNNIPIRLLDTSTERDQLRHNINGITPLPLTSPNCSNRLDTSTPDILSSSSRSVCQALDFRPSVYRPLSNSTPSKRTFSKMNEVNLSKRVRLDRDILKSANENYLD